MTEKTTLAAAYIPFKTLLTALNYLKEHGVPNVIDKTVFPTMSGVNQSQTISALRFLNLIDDSGIPAAELKDLASDEDHRAELLKPILETAYADVFAGNLSGMSPSQFDGIFSAETYGVNGDTLTKARTFFLKAAEYAKVPLSSHLTRRSRKSGPRRKKATATGKLKTNAPPDQNDKPTGGTEITGGREAKTIKLRHGGKLMLVLDVNLWDLKAEDRSFVFGLMDEIEKYENPGEPSAGGEVSV